MTLPCKLSQGLSGIMHTESIFQWSARRKCTIGTIYDTIISHIKEVYSFVLSLSLSLSLKISSEKQVAQLDSVGVDLKKKTWKAKEAQEPDVEGLPFCFIQGRPHRPRAARAANFYATGCQ